MVILLINSCNYGSSNEKEERKAPEIDAKELEAASKLMAENGIPISLFNVGDFETKISRVRAEVYDKEEYPNSPYLTSTHVTLQHKYKGIPIDLHGVLHFNDGKLDSYLSGYIPYPKEKADLILGRGIGKGISLVDYSSLSYSPKITKAEAERIAGKSIAAWQVSDKSHTTELNYYTIDPGKPNELTLVWTVESSKNSAAIVRIDAKTGKILYDFNGIFT